MLFAQLASRPSHLHFHLLQTSQARVTYFLSDGTTRGFGIAVLLMIVISMGKK
ncbi:hypothetical protein BJX76DRAFT_326199 [Aspergillus varians]